MNFCNVLDQEQFIRVKLSTQWDSRKKICCSSKTLPTTRKDGGVHSKLIHMDRDVITPFTANTKAMLSCISKHFFAGTCFAGICTETRMEVTNSSLLVENVVIFQFYVF
ncbi:hypothetical protein Peur_012069 [Populus x canadensis]